MKLTTVLLVVFSLIFLSACGSRKNEKKISDLEDKIATLQEELNKAKDPAAIDAIQKQLREAATQKLEEMKTQREVLMAEVKKTTDQASCDKLKAKIDKLNEDMEKHIVDNAILQYTGGKNFSCTASGYSDNPNNPGTSSGSTSGNGDGN